MKSKILDRLKKLEGAGFSPVVLRGAIRKNFESGELPTNPRLAETVLKIRQALIEIEITGGKPNFDPAFLGFTPSPEELEAAWGSYPESETLYLLRVGRESSLEVLQEVKATGDQGKIAEQEARLASIDQAISLKEAELFKFQSGAVIQ